MFSKYPVFYGFFVEFSTLVDCQVSFHVGPGATNASVISRELLQNNRHVLILHRFTASLCSKILKLDQIIRMLTKYVDTGHDILRRELMYSRGNAEFV